MVKPFKAIEWLFVDFFEDGKIIGWFITILYVSGISLFLYLFIGLPLWMTLNG